jgi:metal-responsive CopG/Arc/MetJ family transcriptional regulator
MLIAWRKMLMRVKTSVILPNDLLEMVKSLSGHYKSRSQFIEIALRYYIAQIKREKQNSRDLEIINRFADRLNEETKDALRYQIPL